MIEITVQKAKNVIGDISAFIRFPFNNELLSHIKSLPRGTTRWMPKEKQWEVSCSELDKFINNAKQYKIQLTIDSTCLDGVVDTVAAIPDDFEFKTKPFEHQIEGLLYGLENKSFILGDEQGLGKTKQVIDIAVAKKNIYGYKHCLIINGVNGVKWNWLNEIDVHSNETGHILGSRTITRGKNVGKLKVQDSSKKLEDLYALPDSYFLITNMESLRDKNITDRIVELCKNGTIGVVAFDEIHKCKNPASQQAKALLKIKAEHMIAMSGTPLMNSPLDLFTVLKWLGYQKHSFTMFKKYFCILGGFGGKEVVGYRNMGELRNLVDNVMLRRKKDDVMDLPDKTHIPEYVELGKAQQELYNEILDETIKNIDKIKLNPNPLASLTRLRQATGDTSILSTKIKEHAKIDRMLELVEDAVSQGDKVIIFSNWKTMINNTRTHLSKYNPAVITGDTKDNERTAMQDKFMKDNNCKVILGTIGAMGTGLTLTAASTVIFLDDPWNPANKEQAVDRAHRIGTKKNVTVYTLIAKDTVDERIDQLLKKKGDISDILIDGKSVVDLADLDFLLS